MKKRGLALLVLLAILVLLPFVYNPAKNVFLFISTPFLTASERTGNFFSNLSNTIRSIRDLIAENEKLQEKIRRLESENSSLKETKNENEILKKQLGFVESNKGLNLIPAYVIGRTPNNSLQYLILNRGEKDGLKFGQVVVSEGIILGKLIEVSSSTSKVFLINSPTSSVPALTQDSRASGLVKGEIGYGLVLEDIPKEVKLIEGENVITSGLGQDLPKGLLIGKIEKVISTASDLFQKASLKPPIDFSKLEIVFIIK